MLADSTQIPESNRTNKRIISSGSLAQFCRYLPRNPSRRVPSRSEKDSNTIATR